MLYFYVILFFSQSITFSLIFIFASILHILETFWLILLHYVWSQEPISSFYPFGLFFVYSFSIPALLPFHSLPYHPSIMFYFFLFEKELGLYGRSSFSSLLTSVVALAAIFCAEVISRKCHVYYVNYFLLVAIFYQYKVHLHWCFAFF